MFLFALPLSPGRHGAGAALYSMGRFLGANEVLRLITSHFLVMASLRMRIFVLLSTFRLLGEMLSQGDTCLFSCQSKSIREPVWGSQIYTTKCTCCVVILLTDNNLVCLSRVVNCSKK
jgi:hypothetical protein